MTSEPNPHPSAAPKKRERETATIIPLPVHSMIDDNDPTRDLRSLIEELQSSVSDGIEEIKKAERENENLAQQLERANSELHCGREREIDLRARLTEATTLDKDRTTDTHGSERHLKTISELQRRLDVLTREQEITGRQREAAARQLDSITRSTESTAAQLAQAQNQIVSIRLARDTTHAQNRAIADKLAKAEDRIAELDYTHESEAHSIQQAADTIEDLRRQLLAIQSDRDILAAQVSTLSTQSDADRQKILDLSQQKSAEEANDDAQDAALEEARAQIMNIALERDAARARSHELAKDLTLLHEQIHSLRAEQAVAKITATSHEDALRQIDILCAEVNAHVACQTQWEQEFGEYEGLRIELMAQLADSQHGREQALTTINLLEEQIETLRRERDAMQARHAEDTRSLEAQLAVLLVQESNPEKETLLNPPDSEQVRTLTKRSESHRLVAIDLAARLDTAQSELIELTASLAEARLQLKFAGAKTSKHALQNSADASAPDSSPASQAPPRDRFSEQLTERDARSAINAMRSCHQIFTKTPTDLSLLTELYDLANSFSERARISGMLAIHRLSSSFAALLHHLREIPESINPSTSRTVQQTIEFLADLVRDRNLTRLKDPTKAQIYAVDDDRDSCDMLSMGLEMAMLHTMNCASPTIALEELATGDYDLIFLDVDLPDMNGFELCAHIRLLENHAHTPIVFITGHNSPEHRSKSALSGANDFVSKPFNLHELGVKSLILILKTQLRRGSYEG